jgi:hydroxymethylpyrimidine/phosphomethylpyrimidine kinase
LTIAGSDSGGGAGIQADLKAFAAAGCHGMSVLVALTAQNTLGVTAVHELPPEFVRAQLEAVYDDIGVDAAKTGMLFSAPIIETVADFLEGRETPLVVDPVMVASSGANLLLDDAVDHFYDGVEHYEFPVPRHDVPATHGAGCTHSATVAALLAKGERPVRVTRAAGKVASDAVKNGLTEIGAGEGPVDVFHLAGVR